MTIATATHDEDVRPLLGRLMIAALVVGVIGIVLWLIAAFFNPAVLFRSYLVGFLFIVGLSLGSLVILMLHNLTGGGWGFSIRRIVESGTRTLPLTALLFIPLLFGIHELYAWSHPGVALGEHKAQYLTERWWIIRSAAYFAVWIALGVVVAGVGGRLERTRDPKVSASLQRISGFGLVLYAVTITFASTDWVMSIEAHWFSTVFGMMFMVGQTLTMLVFAVMVLRVLATRRPLDAHLTRETFNDLGSLMLTFVILWTYMAFVQYLVIWSGNLKEDVVYYIRRTHTEWKWVALALIVLHFLVPFFLLLNRPLKRNIKALAGVALLLVVLRLVDCAWLVAPSYDTTSLWWAWTYVAAIVGLAGLWSAFFLFNLKRRDLVPAFGHPVLEKTTHA